MPNNTNYKFTSGKSKKIFHCYYEYEKKKKKILTRNDPKYKLEIIADTDGYKDYDKIEVVVNSAFMLEKLVPNPASGNVVVHYCIENASSAYLKITNSSGGVSNNYILEKESTKKL